MLKAVKIRPFVPSGEDYQRSLQFYMDLGCEMIYHSPELAILRWDGLEFHLQRYHHREFQDNYMLELCVQDLDAWWQHI